MKVSKSGFGFEITSEDLIKIRDAIRQWKGDPEIAGKFNGGDLYNHYEQWQQFVDSDWEGWDISEYDHDIGCRAWLQLAIENATSKTATLLHKEVTEIDEIFLERMRPFQKQWLSPYLKAPFKNGPYFWETHTIHEEYCEK